MTKQKHPITPPPKLVRAWAALIETHGISDLFTAAAQWGADTELKACCEWLEKNVGRWEIPLELRDTRRPKPPSLKEEALRAISQLENGAIAVGERADTIRRALESIPDPS